MTYYSLEKKGEVMSGLPRWLDINDVADILDINPTHISGLVKGGRFPLPTKATRGKSEHGRSRARAYWKESDILSYKELLDKKAKVTEAYNQSVNDKLLKEMEEQIEKFDKPKGLTYSSSMPKVAKEPELKKIVYASRPVGRPRKDS